MYKVNMYVYCKKDSSTYTYSEKFRIIQKSFPLEHLITCFWKKEQPNWHPSIKKKVSLPYYLLACINIHSTHMLWRRSEKLEV